MKKEYVKPMAVIEIFTISEFIAGNCEIDVGFGESGSGKSCGYSHPAFGGALKLFNDTETCDMFWEFAPENDGGCYHIPKDGHGYFGS